MSENLTRREMSSLKADCCSDVRRASKLRHEKMQEEQELDRCHAEAVLQTRLMVPDNYGYCQICQETYLAMSGRGGWWGGRSWHITKLATHLPLALSVSHALLKTIKGSQPPLRSRGEGDYENNNSFKNYLNVLRELWASTSDTVKHSQAGR